MNHITHVPVGVMPPQKFESVLGADAYADFANIFAPTKSLLEGRVIWNINSTAVGGGVAEMLRSLLTYARGADVDARWSVIEGNTDFFHITKRIHNNLHGAQGDGGPLGAGEKEKYEGALRANGEELAPLIRADDVVILHDPQTAGLIETLKETGARIIWRCHVGLDTPNDCARQAWSFLRPYVSQADAYVFSRKAFAWEELDDSKIYIIAPSIDAFSPKNQEMESDNVIAILQTTGLISDGDSTTPMFIKEDGSPGRVDRRTVMFDGGPPPPSSAPLVVQVSRWDRLKDPVGVIEGFVKHVAPVSDAHLVVAGPAVAAVSDDPEGAEVLNESLAAWKAIPEDYRDRVHLACLPMDDGDENAAIVNALQRRANVVVQKSLAEGFGLTVAEAMWKARPMVASRIGGIQDQIVDGVTGLLVDDPHDLEEYGNAVRRLLEDAELSERLGAEAQKHVRKEFLGPRSLMQYSGLIEKLIS
ncbi:MAG: glycosyltransferase [Actinomycetota bacterium]|nr:glycosyltransferase [Actinomycetota bacterium]